MCPRVPPFGLTLLHALRLHHHCGGQAAAAWLASQDLADSAPAIRTVCQQLAGRQLAPPGAGGQSRHEVFLLEALARIERDPIEAESLLAFLPGHRRSEVLSGLSELAGRTRAGLTGRLRSRVGPALETAEARGRIQWVRPLPRPFRSSA